MATEYLEIPSCPKCSDGHKYKLEVDRAFVMKMLTIPDMNERPRQVKITRLFTCPTKNEEFEASFILTDTSSSRIEEVKVVGIADDKE